MKCTIPEISWHNRDPILSVDIQQNSNDKFIRLATAGADYHVLIWQVLIDECSKTNLEAISDLTRHQRPVNIVRWSPSGQYLASGDDDANIIIWQLKTDNIPSLDGETNDKETWIVSKILRGHKEDVYDLCWSPDNLKLVSGSIDNTAIIWNLGKGKNEHIFTESKGFVQGVSWDPKNQYIALLSSDRVCRIADCVTKQIRSKSFKGLLPVPESHSLYEKEVKYFHDDTFKSFFRRLSFSPDGNLLVAPSGCVESEDCRRYLNATYLYTMDSLSIPAAVLPLTKQSSIAVRFCPVFFELHPETPKPFIDLPYRMVFAVATDNDVILYDTQQMTPFAILQRIHYTRLTDLTWSADGTLLIASSTDGFCTIVTFEKGELGLPYVLEESEPEESSLDVTENEEKEKSVEKHATVNVLQVKRKKVEDVKSRKPNLLENWAIKNNYSENPKERKGEENECKIVEGKSEKINVLQPKRRKCEEETLLEKDKIIEEKPKPINILQPRRKKIKKETSSEVQVIQEVEENDQILNDNECKIVEDKPKPINILQPKRKKTEEKTSSEIKGKSKTINILIPKRKETEETTSSKLIVIDNSLEKLEETDREDKDETLIENNSKTVQEKPKTINILQPKRKKVEETKSPELVVIEHSSEKVEEANSEETNKTLVENRTEEENSKIINVCHPERRKVEETSSELIVINESSEEKDKTKSKIDEKPKKINILQPRRKRASSKETSKELKEKNIEEADKTLNDSKCTTKSKKINILQPRRKITEQKLLIDKSKRNDAEKKDNEENTENSKPRKANILEQWALKIPKK